MRSPARVFWPLAAGLVLADCASKRAVEASAPLVGVPRPVLDGVVRFTLAYNQGAAFSTLGRRKRRFSCRARRGQRRLTLRMPISPYLRRLRDRVGSTRLLLPSVSVHVFDSAGRLLLVRQRDGGVWSTPGGLIEPDEGPADAAVREAWEETGLVMRPERLLGVYGGPACVVRYPNGDEAQYVITALGCSVVDSTGGAEAAVTPRPGGDETDAVRYWSAAEAEGLPLAPWLRAHLSLVYGGPAGAAFTPPTWRPPAPRV